MTPSDEAEIFDLDDSALFQKKSRSPRYFLTGPSEGRLGDYHTRAPVTLEPEAWGTWLDLAQDAGPLMAAVRFGVGV